MDQASLDSYVSAVFPDPPKKAGKVDEKALRRMREYRAGAARLFEHGTGNDNKCISGTLWAAYNGVTEFVDHKLSQPSASEQVDFMWFGAGSKYKENAYSLGRQIVSKLGDSNMLIPT